MGRGSSKAGTGKLFTEKQLAGMTWPEVKKANTKFFMDKSEYGLHRNDEKGDAKYNRNDYMDNGMGGAIKRSDYARIVTEAEWKAARKKAGKSTSLRAKE